MAPKLDVACCILFYISTVLVNQYPMFTPHIITKATHQSLQPSFKQHVCEVQVHLVLHYESNLSLV